MSEFNTQPSYLKQSIESLLSQSYTNFELIIVNDAGKNNLRAIINQYDDERIIVLNNPINMGLVYSLNKAINIAQGKYLVRMDTDDIALPQRIEKLVEFITSHPEYDVVGSRVIEFSDNQDYGILASAGEKTKKTIMRGDPLVHPSVIMNKESILKVGSYPDYKRAEDLGLWCELLLNGSRLFVINDILLKYRVKPEDYNKRKLKYRGGEMRARLHYYPKFRATVFDYIRILRFIISGILPNTFVQKYRAKFKLKNIQDTSPTLTLKKYILYFLRFFKNRVSYYLSSSSNLKSIDLAKHKVMVMLAADYGNLGDIAITNAQISFLKLNFPNSAIIPVTVSETYKYLRKLKESIKSDDIITMLGGGNTGSLYEFIEDQRRFIISKFPRNTIIAFPQSIYYGPSKHEQNYLKKAMKIYSRHDNLYLFARDHKSFKYMKDYFKTNVVLLAPDIVLSSFSQSNYTKVIKKIVLTIRDDKEAMVSADTIKKLSTDLRTSGFKVTKKDTDMGPVKLTEKEGLANLAKILNLYTNSSLIITDRLHGMLFCVITKTPCIAIDNKNGKVLSLYNSWLSKINFIKIVDDLSYETVKAAIEELSSIPKIRYTSTDFTNEFSELNKIINITKKQKVSRS